jgi:hypothetical protein
MVLEEPPVGSASIVHPGYHTAVESALRVSTRDVEGPRRSLIKKTSGFRPPRPPHDGVAAPSRADAHLAVEPVSDVVVEVHEDELVDAAAGQGEGGDGRAFRRDLGQHSRSTADAVSQTPPRPRGAAVSTC